MKTRAALLLQAPGEFEVHDVELDDPRQGEAMIRLVTAGLCHSDDHIATGDIPVGIYPFCGGHEGSGVVERVGPDTPGWEVGDHVVFSFVPACGRCKWCAQGKQNICNLGAHTLTGARFDDLESFRMSFEGRPVGQMSGISTFSEHTTVDVRSLVKVPKHIALRPLSLLACGVSTGWGSAVNAAAVGPGDTVIVMGVGGIGMSAVMGAAHAGAGTIIVVDPVAYKREVAPTFGATDVVATMEEATEIAQAQTDGQGADATIVTVGVTTGVHVGQALDSIRKDGIVVVTGAGPAQVSNVPIDLLALAMRQKRITGSMFGSSSPFTTIPKLTQMYDRGQLKLDELITRTYTLETLAQGYRDMKAGSIIRGVVDFSDA
jgi:S-(hydroxymethyl)glutathione dehydrogenase/alcohol dehydrogenase